MRALPRLILFFVLYYSLSGKAQMFDSIQNALQHKPRFLLKLDSRSSFISNEQARMFGFKIGVDFAKQFRIGGGYNALNSVITRQKYFANAAGTQDTVRSFLQFGYMSYFIEYVFYRTKHWEFSIPLQIGFGNSYYSYNYQGINYKEYKRNVLVYETALSCQYKFIKWAGIGADVGFRLMLKGNKAIEQNLSSPTYAFKFLIYYGEIYRDVKRVVEKRK